MKNKYEIKFNIGLETDLVVEGKDKLDATNILNDYYANGDLLEDFRRTIYDPANMKFRILSIKETDKPKDLSIETDEDTFVNCFGIRMPKPRN